MKKFLAAFFAFFLCFAVAFAENPTLIYYGPGTTNYYGGSSPGGKHIIGIITNGAAEGYVYTYTSGKPGWAAASGGGVPLTATSPLLISLANGTNNVSFITATAGHILIANASGVMQTNPVTGFISLSPTGVTTGNLAAAQLINQLALAKLGTNAATVGQVLVMSSAGWTNSPLNLASANAVTGVLPYGNLPTGTATNATGTFPFITVSDSGGVITVNSNSTKIALNAYSDNNLVGGTNANATLIFASGIVPVGNLGSGTPTAAKCLLGDGTWGTLASTIPLAFTNQLIQTTNLIVAGNLTVNGVTTNNGNFVVNGSLTVTNGLIIGSATAGPVYLAGFTFTNNIYVNPTYVTQTVGYATATRIDVDLNNGIIVRFPPLTNNAVVNLPTNLKPGSFTFTVPIGTAGSTPIWTNGFVAQGGKIAWATNANMTNFVSCTYDGINVNIASSTNMSRPL